MRFTNHVVTFQFVHILGNGVYFILSTAIKRIKEVIEQTYPGYGSPLHLAHQFLREHERFHFKFDLYALSSEAQIGKLLYEPLKLAFRHHRIYQVEEALANRDAWDWAKQKRIGLGELAYDFLKLQPGAYARFDEKKAELSSELAANLLDLSLTRMARRQDQALWIANVPNTFLRKSLCPEYLVYPADLSVWISPAWRLPKVSNITESASFSRLLSSKYASLKNRWNTTKKKLIQDSGIPGLNFKCWDKSTGQWSVRVSDNFRAHLSPVANSPGNWEAQDFGSHKAMGHG